MIVQVLASIVVFIRYLHDTMMHAFNNSITLTVKFRQDLIKQDIKPLEEGLTYDEIYVMRSLALNRIQRMSPPLTPRQQQSSGWTSWVPGWGWGYQSQTVTSSSGSLC